MPPPARTDIELTFRAFSDPVRLRLMSALRAGELCVCDLISVVGLPQATVSRHLAYLKRAGFVQVRRARSWSYYAPAPPRTLLQAKLIEWLEAAALEMPALEDDFMRADKLKKGGGCC